MNQADSIFGSITFLNWRFNGQQYPTKTPVFPPEIPESPGGGVAISDGAGMSF